ncbi:MAG: LTA synthase family protein [Candidatus Binatia bacterium]
MSKIPRTIFCLGFAIIALAIFTGFRLWLYLERAADLGDLSLGQSLELFWIGFRLDAVIVSRVTLAVVAVLFLVPHRWARLLRPVILIYTGLLLFLAFLTETAGLYFFRYYDFRPNYLLLEHGSDTEVLRTVATDYPVIWILLLTATGSMACLLMVRRLSQLKLSASVARCRYPWLWDRLGMFFLILLGAFAARGTLDERALNPSAASVTANRIANEIASSGIFNVLYEWGQRRQGQYIDLESVLRPLSFDEAVRRARGYFSDEGQLTDDSPNPLVRLIPGKDRHKPLNVVMVVMESFTGRLVGALGGSPALTPELDRLALEGVLLENCYATGERTIQGLEAIVSSFPPLPGVGVVRRPQARQGFTTLGHTLKERGYATLFLYGGQGIFDHMRAFFLSNGFDIFIEETDFANVKFRGTWGVSDEDLFERADQEFRKLASRGKPFFATILTVSLHSPWEYPKGRIKPLPVNTPIPTGFKYEELNNFLYADYAVGDFIRKARAAPYFDNTLFVFVGDHGVHLRGRDLVPVDEYRVPVLFLAPSHLQPKRIPRVTSQLDIAPTIMGIVGSNYRSTFFGKEVLTREGDDGLAIMIYNKKRYGVLSGSNLTVLTETGEELAYQRGDKPGEWEKIPPTPALRNRTQNAIALLQMSEVLLKTGRYATAKGTPSNSGRDGHVSR